MEANFSKETGLKATLSPADLKVLFGKESMVLVSDPDVNGDVVWLKFSDNGAPKIKVLERDGGWLVSVNEIVRGDLQARRKYRGAGFEFNTGQGSLFDVDIKVA